LAQEEALWALTWAVAFHNRLDHASFCDNRLANMFPNIRSNEAANNFIHSASLRSEAEILEALDLTYCLHWALVDEELWQKPKDHDVSGYVIVERRRALEWLVANDQWDEISLDT
jgi:hypothetical protein